MRKPSITLERYGEYGWEFSVTITDDLTDKPVTSRFRTNPQGDGLWQYLRSSAWYPDGSPVMEYRQIEGTCQFRLPTDHKRAYDKIRYEWSKDYA